MTSRDIMTSRHKLPSRCSRRLMRSSLVIVMVITLFLFVGINVMYLMYTSMDQRLDGLAREIIKKSDPRVAVQIGNIEADVNGNINIQLSLRLAELLKFLEGSSIPEGAATNNPPPPPIKYLINNRELCETSRELKYIIYVHTSPDHYDKRKLLRRTWASLDLFNDHILERVFLMGRSNSEKIQLKVDAESEKYKDIVQGDFHDNYRNLTLKGLMGLQWVSTHCKRAKFAIKADDDAFVDIFKLRHLLEKYEDKKKVLACPIWVDNSMPILRDPTKCSKWCVKYNEFPGRRYFPQYCAGLTFALSSDLVPVMYQASKKTPFFWIDDVYITGLLPEKVDNIEYVQLIKNFTLKAPEALAELKNTTKPYNKLFVHAKDPADFQTMWDLLLKRISFEEVKDLSTDYIEENDVLKNRLISGNKR